MNKPEGLGTSMPKLARVDGQTMVEKDMERLRLTVAVKSVYYEPGDSGSLKCAVLLRTSFMLQPGSRLSVYYNTSIAPKYPHICSACS
jgi:hypothetical protein